MSATNRDSWDERYCQLSDANFLPHPLVLQAAALLPTGSALDVACGLGRHALALAAQGWHVTAIDRSAVAIARLQAEAVAAGYTACLKTQCADLEKQEFWPQPQIFDLIVVTCYLQRALFPALRASVRRGGLLVAVIALEDDDPLVKPMNPAFLLQTGELSGQFAGWELLHAAEAKRAIGQRRMAELIVRRPLQD